MQKLELETQLKIAVKESNPKNKRKQSSDNDSFSFFHFGFDDFFVKIINNVESVSVDYEKKANNLLLYGIGIIGIGILAYFTYIFYWLEQFKKTGFQMFHLYSIVGGSLSFFFIEMLGGWFLKQYRYFIDKKHFNYKLKITLERQLLAYLYLSEIKKEKDKYLELIPSLHDMLKSEIIFPELNDNNNSAFMKEAFDTLSSLTETVKKVADKK